MDKNKLAERLARLQSKNKGVSDVFFKPPTDGNKTVIRQVPYPHNDDNVPFIEVGWHYNVGGVRSFVCPKETFGEPCPVCELAEQFRTKGGKDNWSIFRKLAPKARYYSPIIVRQKEGASSLKNSTVKLWGYGSTIYEELLEKFMDTEMWGDLADVSKGRDIKVWTVPKEGDEGFDKPKMDIFPTPSKLLPKREEIIELLEKIPNYLEDGVTFKTMSYQELQNIVRKMANYDEDDEVMETAYTERVEEAEDDDSSDDTPVSSNDSELKKKLANLLGD